MDQGRDITLHQRIVNDIEGRIVSGEWVAGSPHSVRAGAHQSQIARA